LYDGKVLAQETTLLHHIFGGYERMQNVCTVCRNVSASFDPFSMLSVEMDEDITTLENALARCSPYHFLYPAEQFCTLPVGLFCTRKCPFLMHPMPIHPFFED
jgi:ubiquitin C-terminal hydrolase